MHVNYFEEDDMNYNIKDLTTSIVFAQAKVLFQRKTFEREDLNWDMSNSKKYLLLVFLFLLTSLLSAQFKLLPDKSGKFTIKYWSLSSSNFSKAETNAYLKKIGVIPELLRKNPVLSNPLGFDCDVDVHSQESVAEYGSKTNKKFMFGIPSVINFHTCFFFVNDNGKEVRFSIEPPHWDILVNRLAPYTNGGPLTKDHDLFFVSTDKITLKPGMDVYDKDKIFIYNPARPAYLVPVTIKEVFKVMLDYYKNDEDQIAAGYAIKMLEDEYSLYSETEKNEYAYMGGRGQAPLSNVDTKLSSMQVMRVNPEYWNKKLPRSAVQTIAFECNTDKNFYDREIVDQLKTGNVNIHIYRILKDLDIESLLPVIDK